MIRDVIIIKNVEDRTDIGTMLNSSSMRHENCGNGEIIVRWGGGTRFGKNHLILECRKCKNCFPLDISFESSIPNSENIKMINLLTKKIYYSCFTLASTGAVEIGWEYELEERREKERREKKFYLALRIILLILALFVIIFLFLH